MQTDPNKVLSLSWTDVWTAAITRPQVSTFDALLADPNAKPRRAMWWLLLTSIVFALVTYNILFNNSEVQTYVTQTLAQNGTPIDPAEVKQALIIVMLCASPFAALFSVLGYAILTLAIQFVADQMGAPQLTKGKFKQLFYLVGAIVAPLMLINAFLNIINSPIVAFLSIIVFIYQTYLMTLAARALYQMDRRSAAVAVGGPTLIFFFIQLFLLNGFLT